MEPSSGAAPGLIVYSTRTGNTRYVAEGISATLAVPHNLLPIEELGEPVDRPWILLGYWVDRGTADPASLALLERLKNQCIGLFGTLGAYPDSDHAADVSRRVQALVEKENRFLGSFLCQGRVDPALIEKFKQFPPDHPHALNEARRKRHADAASHPDGQDVARAVAACREMLASAGLS